MKDMQEECGSYQMIRIIIKHPIEIRSRGFDAKVSSSYLVKYAISEEGNA